MKRLSLLLTLLLITGSLSAKDKTPWSVDFKPGDLVCIYDIAKGDPLIHHESNHSFKYWYRSKIGFQKSRYELRPSILKLVFRVLHPGLVKDEKTGWYTGALVVQKGGIKNTVNYSTIDKGRNRLLLLRGKTYVAQWQLLFFEAARFKKGVKGFGCKRNYPKY